MARVVVCGYMVRHPVGGNLLAFFHYVLGLERLGHEVTYVEESGWPYSCYDPVTRHWHDHPHTGLAIVRALLAEHGLTSPVYYVNREAGSVDGGTRDDLRATLAAADLLLNIGGVCWLPDFGLCQRRALIDMDPLFTQAERFAAKVLHDYDVHFSYGVNIGRPTCPIPTAGVDWLPAVPPVVAELWAYAPATGPVAPFTTVANWTSYGGIAYRGDRYGQKDEEFMRLVDLPGRLRQPLELAVSDVPPDVAARLRAAGWTVRRGDEVSRDLPTYRDYILLSRAEFSAAKNAYVKTRSGWFSDRSVCYLAAGRPVVLQDTGFSDWLPTGRGVLAFSSVEEAADCVGRVNGDYPAHCRAARELAERVFDYRVVLPRLLGAALHGRPGRRTAAAGAAP